MVDTIPAAIVLNRMLYQAKAPAGLYDAKFAQCINQFAIAIKNSDAQLCAADTEMDACHVQNAPFKVKAYPPYSGKGPADFFPSPLR